MAFNLFEIASFMGRPVCLYEFAWGATFYRYTSADREIEYGEDEDGNPIKWAPIAISDSGFTQGASAQDFVVTLPRANPIVDLFRSTPPSSKIVLTCRRFHRDDPANEATVYWVGTVGNVKGKDANAAEVLGLPISSTLRRTGLRLPWVVNCPHALYDAGCKANKDLFRVDTTITALTGVSVTLASFGAFAGERFAGGFLEWEATAEGTIDRRAIERHMGGTELALLGRTDRLVVGQAVSIYLGCDLTAATCASVFNNLPNHGGFPMLSKKSPFDGNPVF
jgi:uncharacterized phage protein (TIGR02218 family)